MKRLAPILFLAATVPGIAPAVEWGLPWFHTRPKPVFLDDHTAQPVSQKLVKHNESRGTAADEMSRPVWTDTGRSREKQKSRSFTKATRILAPGATR